MYTAGGFLQVDISLLKDGKIEGFFPCRSTVGTIRVSRHALERFLAWSMRRRTSERLD